MSSRQNNRDLRTLLFCKLTSAADFRTLETLANKQMSSSETNHSWDMYYAFGGYNALCVYPTLPTEQINDNNHNWLSKVYEDKQQFASNVTAEKLVCHQMHLISQNNYLGFWQTDAFYPFFFVTLVYGVLRRQTTDTDSNNFCSLYESLVAEYLNKAIKQEDPLHCKFAIYNGINIGDVVIFWKSNDIAKTLSLISKLGYGKVARKTLTTIALPINSKNAIDDNALNCLKNASTTSKLELLIRGTVKNVDKFNKFVKRIQEFKPYMYGPFTLSLNPGKYDFTLSRKVTPKELADFLENVLLGQSELVQQACWEIHTDLLVPKNQLTGEGPTSTDITPVITNLYDNYLEIYKTKKEQYHFSWWDSLLEQYSTQYYIDRHPTLHGPAYLVYRSLHILNGYLTDLPTKPSTDDFTSRVLTRSEESINHYISCLNLLMDQITHNDNAMISGYPNVHSILFSLPESMLDFYHAFLRTVVEVLNKFDKDRIPKGFEYDFLFTPQQGPRFRFCPVINAGLDLRKDKNSKQVWPVRQAYVLEVPMKSLFEPMQLFPPMVHECFHCFGDELRQRARRKHCMGDFIATTIVTALGFGAHNYVRVEQAVRDYLCDDSNEGGIEEPYLLEAVQHFRDKLQCLFSRTKSVDAVFERSNNTAYCLYTSSTIAQLQEIAMNFYGGNNKVLNPFSVLRACKYYFKECYADTMTIALLQLSPMEYLTLIQSELDLLEHSESDRNEKDELATELAQRFAIVLASCYLSKLSNEWSLDGTNGYAESNTQFEQLCHFHNKTFFHYLKEYFLSLIKEDHVLKAPSTDIDGFTGQLPFSAFPPAALRYVVDYLLCCVGTLVSDLRKSSESNSVIADSLQTLRNDFDQIIRGGDMFSRRFYDLIYQQHQDIRDAIKGNNRP